VNFGDYFVAEDSRSLLLLIFMCRSWKKGSLQTTLIEVSL